LKDLTISFSSSCPILFNQPPHRLYVVTGKGGVGKTALALALTKAMNDQGYHAVYNSFDTEPPYEILKRLELPYIHHSVEESAQVYIGLKLGSPTIGKWVMMAPFFKALFNMLPGLSSMILLGHLIKQLESQSHLHMVIDAPASGHAMTMFEAPFHFRDMFKKGLIVDDIERMLAFARAPQGLNTIITTLPTELSVQEAGEFINFMKRINVGSNNIVINQDLEQFFKINNISANDLPPFLKEKLNSEEAILKNLSNSDCRIPFIPNDDLVGLVKEMSNYLFQEKASDS
jgi:anion-transporting  ArsA/GET3 family ATPase